MSNVFRSMVGNGGFLEMASSGFGPTTPYKAIVRALTWNFSIKFVSGSSPDIFTKPNSTAISLGLKKSVIDFGYKIFVKSVSKIPKPRIKAQYQIKRRKP